ncbi:MAG: Rid family detoxifying hydrolase [Deltaproteobacteria bacterium]|jgi:2-iminobutanoate/2-iminopropanoate deaminase|nr:Rid family detoxifying hydrolase [Deltaproteobacteria bacterium]
MAKIETVYTKNAPPPGPYAQAIKYGGLVFVSGQTPEDPQTGEPIRGTMAEQTRVVLTNISAILQAAGSSLDKVLKVNIYLSDIAKKPEMNSVYKEFFKNSPPARIAMAVAGLDDALDIEIDVIAACDE